MADWVGAIIALRDGQTDQREALNDEGTTHMKSYQKDNNHRDTQRNKDRHKERNRWLTC
jgi:hypothetical protein